MRKNINEQGWGGSWGSGGESSNNNTWGSGWGSGSESSNNNTWGSGWGSGSESSDNNTWGSGWGSGGDSSNNNTWGSGWGSGGDSSNNTNTPNYETQWSKYPCVVELAKSKGVSLGNSGEYLIGDFKYFANGRKGILSTGKVVDFTCNDPEFKKSSSGSQSSGSQPVKIESRPTQIPSELKDINGVKKFQYWLDVNHPGWHRKYGTLNQNLLRGYGKYGPNTNRAWNNQSIKDEYLKTSNSTATPNSESPSNWMDLFPSCVKGLKSFYNPPNNYFFGFGTDTEGAQYMIGYYSQKFKNGQRCEIYKDGSLVGNGFYSCTTNNQQITIKTLSGLSITGSVINPDYGNITSPKNDDETLEPSDDDVLKDNKVRVSKNTGI